MEDSSVRSDTVDVPATGAAKEGASTAPPTAMRRLSIAIIQGGSRGDVQPACLLGRALQRAGHRVWMVAEARNSAYVASFGIEYRMMAGDANHWQSDAAVVERVVHSDPVSSFKLASEWRYRLAPIADVLASIVDGAAGADLIVSGGQLVAATISVADFIGAAFAFFNLVPWVAYTTDYGLPVLPLALRCRCSRTLNKLVWDAALRSTWEAEAAAVNEWRVRTLGLSPCTHPCGPFIAAYETGSSDRRAPIPTIIAGSTLMCIDGRPASDWGASQPLVGPYLAPLPTAPPPADLEAFLRPEARRGEGGGEGSRPVVYIGFGSMGHPRPGALAAVVVEACAIGGVRAVLVEGWSNFSSEKTHAVLRDAIAAGTVFVAAEVSHAWLFPRVAAIVHHAGIGTANAALASGTPQVRLTSGTYGSHGGR
jgi:sterol 3beta-glucosyltransferase